MTDWGPGLQYLGLAAQDWGPSYKGTYGQLVAGWRGPIDCPDEATLLQANSDAAAAFAVVVARLQGIKDDPLCSSLVAQLRTATAAQISTYVDSNVTDLASARIMLKRIIMVLARLTKIVEAT